MKTYFANPQRASDDALNRDVELVANNEIISTVLSSVNSLVAVLNKHRQIVAINETYLQFLGIDEADKTIGLRPGEVVNCIHAHEMEAGCGTSKHCSSCGAAIAIVTSMHSNSFVEKFCALTAKKNGQEENLYLSVTAKHITFKGESYTLLFMRDITDEQQRAILERVFFHDLRNTMTSIVGLADILLHEIPDQYKNDLKKLASLTMRMTQEVEIQETLLNSEKLQIAPRMSTVWLQEFLQDFKEAFDGHPLAYEKKLLFPDLQFMPDISFITDPILLMRILNNMVINALEATNGDAPVRILFELNKSTILFSVWNAEFIPERVSNRVFQRNFSTKAKMGRGLGTYSMKLLGEKVLGGSVGFNSQRDSGTTFWIQLSL